MKEKKKRVRLSNAEKLNLMLEYMNETGKKITIKTKYKGVNIGYLKNNLRQRYYNGLLNIDDTLLNEYIKVGIIPKVKEKNRTSQQEKYNFLMSLADKDEITKKQAKMKSGLTYNKAKYQLQVEYNRNKIKLTNEQINNLKKENILGYSKIETKQLTVNYKMPIKYVMDIKKKYSSKEEFIKKYKKCQCNYDFGNDVFCGFRGIIISKKDMNEYQKLQYVLAIKDIFDLDISELEYSTGKYLDIDEFQKMLMILPDIKRKVYTYYNSLDGKKYKNKQIDNMLGLARGRTGQIMKRFPKYLTDKIQNENYGNTIIRDYNCDCKKIEEYDNEIDKLKLEIEDLQVINDFFINIENGKEEKFTKENIMYIQNLIRMYLGKISISIEKINLDNLNLSVRTYNCLKKANINTLYDIINFTEEELINIKNLGEISYDEILRKVKEYDLPMKNFYDEFNLFINPKNTDISEINLSVRAYNCLKRTSINTLYDVLNLTEEDLLKVRNLGYKAYNEILNIISSMGVRLKRNNEEINSSLEDYEGLILIKKESKLFVKMYQYFRNSLKHKLEKKENIIKNKELLKVKINRYNKAVMNYINKEDIFDSKYIVQAV